VGLVNDDQEEGCELWLREGRVAAPLEMNRDSFLIMRKDYLHLLNACSAGSNSPRWKWTNPKVSAES
jgi:hypothetical protein